MPNQRAEGIPPSNLQKYGVPFYAAGWIPDGAVRSKIFKDRDKSEDGELSSSSSSHNYAVLAGGGGEGHSGIPNAIIVSKVDISANYLSEVPVAKLVIGSDLPYRMTVHPGEDGLICALPNSCRLFDWEEVLNSRADNLGVQGSRSALNGLKDVGQQLALAFNHDGSVLAAGGEDGTLRVFKWPSMEVIINEAKVHPSVKDLSFSSSDKFLVSLGASLCRIWDVAASTAVASLSKEKDEIFAFSRFSQVNGDNEVLFVAAMTERGGNIITWDTNSWKRRRSKQVTKDAISAFNVSADGNFLAVGTIEGDVFIIDSRSIRTNQVVKKAHLGIVTALRFSPDSRGLVSASMDSSCLLTPVKPTTEEHGVGMWVVLFVMLLAMVVYLLKAREIIR